MATFPSLNVSVTPELMTQTFAEDLMTTESTTVTVYEVLGNFRPRPNLPKLMEIGSYMQKYGIPTVAGIGVIGNLLTITLMHRPFLRRSTSSVYFSSLAVVDMLHLLHSCVAGWYRRFFGIDLYGYYDVTCKLKNVLFSYNVTAPAWLVVAMTTERLVVTTFPIRGKLWCTRRVALAVSITICLVFAVVFSILVFRWGVSSGPCDPVTDRLVRKFFLDYGYIVIISLYTFVPSPLLLMLNAGLIYQVQKAWKFRNAAAEGNKKAESGHLFQITLMALIVSVSYMLLTMPAMVFFYLDVMVNEATVADTRREPTWKFLRDISNVLRELNHAINFFIYLLVLPRMKTELAAMLLPCRNRPNQDSAATNTSSTGASKLTSPC